MTSLVRTVDATAPTRVDLAGGTLDIWPLYLFHPGAVTVNAAIDRRARCRVAPLEGGVRFESKDALVKREADRVQDLIGEKGVSLAACVLDALGIETGVAVTTHSRVPAGSGLGGSSALAVAVAAAAAAATGRDLATGELWPIVRDAEARSLGMPAGTQDHLAAIHGGVLVVRLQPGAPIVDRLSADPGQVQECLLLVNVGQTRFSGINNWDVFKGQIDGDAGIREALGKIGSIAADLARALEARDAAAVTELINLEWDARKTLGAGVTSPEIDRIVSIARGAGGAAKVCGAGGGGVVLVWAVPDAGVDGPRERVAKALQAEGLPTMDFRLDLRGLDVDEA